MCRKSIMAPRVKVIFHLVTIAAICFANGGTLRAQTEFSQKSAVYVEPVTLTEVSEHIGFGMNIGAVIADEALARGVQKAADVYGLNLDLFVLANKEERRRVVEGLIAQQESYILVDTVKGEDWSQVETRALKDQIPLSVLEFAEGDAYEVGFSALVQARSKLLDQIPKYEQVLPIAFPISPLPDNFFQPSKFPYPSPLIRAQRTNESFSASSHAHVSCNMVAQTGNMLHRTSSIDSNRLLMGMEGGNLSLQALSGAIEKPKISAVMTSWVLNIGEGGKKRTVLVENNGLESSLFEPGIHAPEELTIVLDAWRKKGDIANYDIVDHETVMLFGWHGKDRLMKAGMFLVANDRSVNGPVLIEGRDRYGAKTLDFYSTQAFVQQLAEVMDESDQNVAGSGQIPQGGLLTSAGTTVGNMIGQPLSHTLVPIKQSRAPVQPYVLNIEGGFMVVTPEAPISPKLLDERVERLYLDLRGPLTSDQRIEIHLGNEEVLVFRRTVLNFEQLDDALNSIKSLGMVSGWEYKGERGRGLFANVVLHNFLGKHRKFMSSLSVWPTDEKPEDPLIRFYVDGMQRLNFTFLSESGWRQEFVEVPLRIPPVPRDVTLFSGLSNLRD